MTIQDERALLRRYQAGDRAAGEEILREYGGLVYAVAGRFRLSGMEREDLEQEGRIGLLKAAEKWDETRRLRFSTYAMHWIRSLTRRGWELDNRLIRIPAGSLHKALSGGKVSPSLAEAWQTTFVELDERDVPADYETPEVALIRKESHALMLRSVRRCLGAMNPRHRAVAMLTLAGRGSYEIAAQVGVKRKSAVYLIRASRAKLAQMMGELR